MEVRAIDQLDSRVLLHVQTAVMAADEGGRVGVYNPAAARAWWKTHRAAQPVPEKTSKGPETMAIDLGGRSTMRQKH